MVHNKKWSITKKNGPYPPPFLHPKKGGINFFNIQNTRFYKFEYASVTSTNLRSKLTSFFTRTKSEPTMKWVKKYIDILYKDPSIIRCFKKYLETLCGINGRRPKISLKLKDDLFWKKFKKHFLMSSINRE